VPRSQRKRPNWDRGFRLLGGEQDQSAIRKQTALVPRLRINALASRRKFKRSWFCLNQHRQWAGRHRLTRARAHLNASGLLGMMGLLALISIAMIGYLYGCDVSDD
jgi:hypothetical protein